MVLTFFGILIYTTAEHWRMRAVLEERSRMAREIHDTLAQGFAGIALQLESALQQSRAENVGIGSVAMAFHMAQESRREAHRSIAALRTLHTNEPLENMLQKVLRPLVAGSRLDLSVSRSGDPQRLSGEAEGQVLRIAQEAVANAVQHAMAKQIEVRLVFEQNQLRVVITDNGQGFNLSGLPAVEDGHFGITGMKERANSIGADFKIQSNGNGTIICLIVPLPRQRAFWRSVNWWMRPFKTSMRPSRSG
jgi:signal transduction histidine kinase